MGHPAHKHDEPHGNELVDAAQEALIAAGVQWTPMRAGVFQALASFSKPASAYDIAEAMSRTEGRRVAANSVYRILDVFVATNVAQRVESANAYIVNVHPGCRHDCMFLICDQCGDTAHLDDDLITQGVRRAAASAGFAATRPVIEVRGLCSQCRTDH
jgi:Fur family zinc uptake transcriptional regulator